jgi:O-antigen/teichoic acid export membrane protein
MKFTSHAEITPLPRRGGMTRGALAGFVGEGTGLVCAVVAIALLARHLGPEAFGLFGLAAAASAAVGWSLAPLFSRAALVLVPVAKDPLGTAGTLFRACLKWGLAGWLIFALAGLTVAQILGMPVLFKAFAVAGSEVLLLALSRFFRGVLTATGDYAAPGIGAGLFHVARLGAVFAVILAGGGAVAALATIAVARSGEIAWYWTRLRLPLGGGGPMVDLAGMAGSTLVQSVSIQLFNRVDILLLGALGTAAGAVGWYAAAQHVAVIPALVAGVVAPMATVALARGKDGRDLDLLDRRTDQVAASGVVLFLAAVGAAPPFVPVLFGPEFAPAAPLFAWLALGGAGAWLNALGSGRWAAAGRMRVPAALSAVALVVAVPAHLLAIPEHGPIAAALITSIAGVSAGLGIHLSAPGRSAGRALLTAVALGFGALAALVLNRGITSALAALGWAI